MNIRFVASGSTGNCGIVDDGKTVLLLDAGISFKNIQIEIDFDFSRLGGVLLTHSHGDHSKAIKDLIKRGVDCYMSQDTAEALKVSGHRVKIVEPKKHYQIGTFNVMPFDLVHDVTNYGYMFASSATNKKGVYLVDTPYCKYKFAGINYFCTEVNYIKEILDDNMGHGNLNSGLRNRIVESHFSLEHAIKFFKANDLSKTERIYLLHLSNGNSDEVMIKDKIQRATGVEVVVAG